ncbi:MAG: methyltransferase domain-containing protein [Pseudomonadota bacterium]
MSAPKAAGVANAAPSDANLFDRALLRGRRARAAGLTALNAADGRAASGIDFLVHRAAEDIAERLAGIQRTFTHALALGDHHGVVTRHIKPLANVGTVFAADDTFALLRHAPAPALVCDPEALPFAQGSLDLVASALTLHAINDLPGTLIQIARALKPDGLFMGALIGGRTLHELRTSLMRAQAEVEGGASPFVAPFADVPDLGSLLQRAGFALPVVDADRVEVAYETPLQLMRDLRGMGATNVLHARQRAPLRRETLARAAALYQHDFARGDGRVIATFEILTMTGWRPHESQQKPLRPGSARQSLAAAFGTQERPAGEQTPRPRTNAKREDDT